MIPVSYTHLDVYKRQLNALSAADSVIIPVQAQYLPAKGMTQLVQTISKVKKYINPDIKIDGMLLTLVDSRTNLAKSTVAVSYTHLDVYKRQFSKSDFRAVKVKECVAVPKSKKLLQFTLDDGTGTDRTILSGIHAYYEPEELVGKTLIAITNLPPRAMMGIDSCGMLLSAIHEEEGEEKLHLLMVDDHIPAGAKLY